MNFSTLDLNLLRVLDALLSEGSTVKAGARIGLSQPAVSAALGRLRHALGDELFLRRGQGLEPTDFARGLAAPLRAALDEIEALLGGPGEFDPATAERTFRLLGGDFFSELLMPEMARRIGAGAPGLRLRLLGLSPTDPLALIERREADVALIPERRIPDWAEARRVVSCEMRVVARPGHPAAAGLAPGAPFPLAPFCACGHAVFSQLGADRTQVDAALARIGRRRNVAMTLPGFRGVARVAAGSDLIALLPHQLADRWADGRDLTAFTPPVQLPPIRLAMVWRRSSSSSPAHRWLRGQIAEILGAAA